jgi:uncharacterized protein (DUF2252 family)
VIAADPPLIVRFDDLADHATVEQFFATYVGTLSSEHQHVLRQYRYVDAARKVVGVGSVGMRASIVLLEGRAAMDPLFLQMKEAQASVLEPYAGRSLHATHGERVVAGQRLMQATSDLFLGWATADGVDYYMRQLRDMKGSVNLEHTTSEMLLRYSAVCGITLANAHARSVGPGLLSGYLGTGGPFIPAMVAFAHAYADQTERDYALLQEAHRSGRLEAILDR